MIPFGGQSRRVFKSLLAILKLDLSAFHSSCKNLRCGFPTFVFTNEEKHTGFSKMEMETGHTAFIYPGFKEQ